MPPRQKSLTIRSQTSIEVDSSPNKVTTDDETTTPNKSTKSTKSKYVSLTNLILDHNMDCFSDSTAPLTFGPTLTRHFQTLDLPLDSKMSTEISMPFVSQPFTTWGSINTHQVHRGEQPSSPLPISVPTTHEIFVTSTSVNIDAVIHLLEQLLYNFNHHSTQLEDLLT
ncbi:hypothetical protein Dimus_039726 [Dionaea muscipula]